MSTRQDLDFHNTEDWTIDFACEDGDGTPINITGATLSFKLANIATGAVIMTRTQSDGITITSATDGECTLRVTPAHQTTAGIVASTRYLWEFRVTVGGVALTQANGHLNVLPSLF